MKKNKYILIGGGIVVLILVALAGSYWYEVHKVFSERDAFVSNLANLSHDIAPIESFPPDIFQSIEDKGGGWFSINGNDANPTKDLYYMGLGGPSQVATFTSSTGLTTDQVRVLTGIFEKYPYIAFVKSAPNVNAQYLGKSNASSTYVAIKFYPPIPLPALWFSNPAQWYSDGFMYIPFAPNASEQDYLNRNFGSMREVAPNWYEFSGEHI